MKRLLTLFAVVCLIGLSGAVAPTVYSVVITPLYGNTGSSLTCLYISSNASASAKYRFYDNGVWYNSASATYSTALVSGRSYNCSVNLTGGGASTGWYNSSNDAEIGDYCVNPYPLYYKNKLGLLNLSVLADTLDNLRWDVIAFGGDYGLTSAHVRSVENNTIVFLGGGFNQNGADKGNIWLMTNNIMFHSTGSGNFTLNISATDENLATYVDNTATSTNAKYSNFTSLSAPIQSGTRMRLKTGLKTSGAGAPAVEVFKGYNGSAWITLATHSSTSTAGYTDYTDYFNFNQTYYMFSIKHSNPSAGISYLRFYEFEMLNWTSGAISGTLVTPSDFTLDNFSTVGGYVFAYNYINEETGTAFNFSDGGDLNTSRIEVGCASASTEVIDTTDDVVGKDYLIGSTEDLRQIKTYMVYDDTSELFRVTAPICTSSYYQDTDQYLPDAGSYTVRAYTFTLDDQSADDKYEDGWLKVKRSIGGGLGVQVLHAQDWGGTKSVLTYLIDNREYTISLIADDCSENALGYVTSNPAVTTFALSASGSTINTSYFNEAYENFQYNFDYVPTDARINFTYNDSDGAVDWVWWGVYDADNGSLMYSDNSTADNYRGSYVVTNISKRYYGRVIFRRNNQTVSDILEGGLTRQEDYLEELEYTGSIMGMEYPTLFMLVSLGVMCVSALLISPASVGIGLMLAWSEGLFFSVIGWLPFISGGVGVGAWTKEVGWIALTLGFIVCVIVMYTEKR